jgi:hypothetical protein
MTVEKLASNLGKLLELIPKKPSKFTSDFPTSIAECFHKYMRRRTVNYISIFAVDYDQHGWVFPLFVNPCKLNLGRINTLLAQNSYFPIPLDKPNFNWVSIPNTCERFNAERRESVINFSFSYIEMFAANINNMRKYFLNHKLLENHDRQIKDIINCCKKGYWTACICSVFPLLDFVIRKIFKTKKLERDITYIVGIFKRAGFDFEAVDNLKPNQAIMKAVDQLVVDKTTPHEELIQNLNTVSEKTKNYGFIGVALSSFLYFSYEYYAYYRRDDLNTSTLNRHAILHGATNEYSTPENCVRLISFLYLTLELEPVLKIVLNEE